jgi:hypothetical protein
VTSRLRSYLRQHHVALLALFLSLGLGSAWAATDLTKNEVKSKNIAPGAVHRSDLRANAVNSPKVANGSLRKADLAAGVLPTVPTVPTVEATKTVTSFVNGWEAFDQGTPGTTDDAPVRFWKDPWGTVHLEGAVQNANPTPLPGMFQLPAGYRPEANYLSFAVVTTGTNDFNEVLGFVQVSGECCGSSSGAVDFQGGNKEYVSLDGITFRAK